MDILKYKGYQGSFEYSEEDKCLYGEVLGLSKKTCIAYEGSTPEELITDFKDAVDFYLESCEAKGKEPEKPEYRVEFNMPVSVFEQVNALATKAGLSLNAYMSERIENPVAI